MHIVFFFVNENDQSSWHEIWIPRFRTFQLYLEHQLPDHLGHFDPSSSKSISPRKWTQIPMKRCYNGLRFFYIKNWTEKSRISINFEGCFIGTISRNSGDQSEVLTAYYSLFQIHHNQQFQSDQSKRPMNLFTFWESTCSLQQCLCLETHQCYSKVTVEQRNCEFLIEYHVRMVWVVFI